MSEDLKASYLADLQTVTTLQELAQLKAKYLGKKGVVTLQLKTLGALSAEERPHAGKRINELKEAIESLSEAKEVELTHQELAKRLASESIDITLPGKTTGIGRAHPISTVLNEIIDIFVRLGFSVEEGPEVELDHYNFEALNIPKDHPARDMQDTFYVSDDVVLRTHTSPVQVRVMERQKPPLRFIAPGKVYRCDADVSHTPMFHQVEGLVVDTHITFSNLKGVLVSFVHQMFGPQVPVRFRPSFFPFTEPSAEIDIGCILCDAKGCRVCKGSGWLEVMGAGMVNPKVLEFGGIDPELYTGFAFGMGVERITMLKYRIDDIRLLFENDLRFLRQF
ncbi:MAG: phenylalanine--tRNA ligase subunit alpha [Nitrospiraceae bacterium]|jgi:phenylalanyl-tRNA synthetase alpha chain|nr:phenylalanine--tRNA ligase subunit alpha [Nitrospiraceae bacterium]